MKAARKPGLAFDFVLVMDAETSGVAIGQLDPTVNHDTGERYQAISIGLIIAETATLKPIDQLYVEIKFDADRYTWSEGAEGVHGMSREYLEANGVSIKDAAIQIVSFLEKYYGPIEAIRKLVLLGHNVATFDRYFLADLFDYGLDGLKVQFGNRHIDTFSLGVVLMDLLSSDELFDFFGLVRDTAKHNALEDAKYALKVARLMKKHFQEK